MKNAHVLVTGATGFVGQAVVEKLLSSYPSTRLTLLVRPRGAMTAQKRVDKLLTKPCFKPWRDAVGEEEAKKQAASRITVLAGDLEDVPALPKDLDYVIHSASTVSFDLPIDEAFAANVGGALNLYQAITETGADPHVVHVSTCYVAGLRKGLAEERSLDHQVDREAEMARALAARADVEAASRRPEILGPIVAKARAEHRRAGAQAVAEAAEAGRAEWVKSELVEAARTRANSLGWPDIYTFTKALGERVAEEKWGKEHRLSIVRPTIIESSLRHPFPGWIDGFKVADPLIAAYGRGMLPEFPALADTILDVIPVDFVVNAILAAAASPPEVGSPRYVQVSSGSRNPLRFGMLLRLVRAYFRKHPMTDADGTFIQVPNWTFPNGPSVERSLRRREFAVDAADKVLTKLPANATTRGWISKVFKAKRGLRTLRKFTDLYQPYTQTEVIFDDSNARALHEALADERKSDHGFDVTEIDWAHYLQEVHVPKIPGLMRAQRPSIKPSTKLIDPPKRSDVLAIFDLHGTVAAASLIEHYVWVELAAKSKLPAVRELAGMVASSGTYLQAEKRDRGDFIRSFMRRYHGINEAELREVIATKVAPSLRARVHAEAKERIEQHRAAGHRTVLITGQIDVFVEPLADMFDVIVAGEMEKDPAGRWTGHLATSPLVDEARSAWIKRYAREEGMDLDASYAYGDTYSDRPWLEIVGNPNVVNPDASLFRYAKAKRWPVHTWRSTAEGRFSPVVRSIKGAAK